MGLCATGAVGVLAAGPLEQCRHRSPDTGPQLWDPAQAEPGTITRRPKRRAVAIGEDRVRRCDRPAGEDARGPRRTIPA